MNSVTPQTSNPAYWFAGYLALDINLICVLIIEVDISLLQRDIV